LVLVEPTHRGVLFGPRGSAREVGPGLVTYWPITHALTLVPVTTQSVQLSTQMMVEERDSLLPCVLLCAVAVQFRSVDAVLTATRALNSHALVDNRVSAAIVRRAGMSGDLAEWARVTALDLRQELASFGVFVERIDFTQFGVGVALKNLSDWNYSDSADGTRPKQ
jgi:hypothetical protein